MRRLEYAAVTIIGLLFFIWPISHTISIRYALTLAALFILIYIFIKRRPALPVGLLIPGIIYAAITVWILFGAVLISPDTARTLDEIRGQWLISFIAGAIGIIAMLVATENGGITAKRVLTVIVATLAVHILYVDILGVVERLTTGAFSQAVVGFTGGRDKSSYLTNHLLMILGAEFFYRSLVKRRMIAIGPIALVAVTLLTLFSVYLEGARNGTATALLSCMGMLAFYLFTTRFGFKRVGVTVLLFLALLGFGYNSVKNDARWESFKETVPLALDTEGNKAWLNEGKYPPPKLKSGVEVTGSNYKRIAWFKEGLKLIAENPLGIGFDRGAFGHAIEAKHGEEGFSHSHSGFIDLAVGIGIPGIILWYALLLYLVATAIKNFIRYKSYFALGLLFTICNFSMRMMVDSIARDHMFQQFIFLAALFFTAMLMEIKSSIDKQESLTGW